jgi:hypothetical protein
VGFDFNLECKLYLEGPGRVGEEGGFIKRGGEGIMGGMVGGEGSWEKMGMGMREGACGPMRPDRNSKT